MILPSVTSMVRHPEYICQSNFIYCKYLEDPYYLVQFINECILLRNNNSKMKYDLVIYIDMEANIITHPKISIVQLIQLLNECIDKYKSISKCGNDHIMKQNILASYKYFMDCDKSIIQCNIIKLNPLRFSKQ